MVGSRSRHILRRIPSWDCADGFLLSRPRSEGGRSAAPSGMRAVLACAIAPTLPGHRANSARRQLRDRLLCARFRTALHDSFYRAMAGFSARILRLAASELAHDALAARQSLVRGRGVAGAARPGATDHGSEDNQSDHSISAMSSLS